MRPTNLRDSLGIRIVTYTHPPIVSNTTRSNQYSPAKNIIPYTAHTHLRSTHLFNPPPAFMFSVTDPLSSPGLSRSLRSPPSDPFSCASEMALLSSTNISWLADCWDIARRIRSSGCTSLIRIVFDEKSAALLSVISFAIFLGFEVITTLLEPIENRSSLQIFGIQLYYNKAAMLIEPWRAKVVNVKTVGCML
jgi:hypothetical protein